MGDCSLALAGLRGHVSQGERCYAGPFFKEVERGARENEDDFSVDDSDCNEGLIFDNYVCSAFVSIYPKSLYSYHILIFIYKELYHDKNYLNALTCSSVVLSENPACGLGIQGRKGVRPLTVY